MEIRLTDGGDTARVVIDGRFDFDARRAFMQACDSALANGAAGKVVVDLGRVSYLDSSALGMLLVLRDKAHAAGKPLGLAVAPGMVRDVLDVAQFHKLFTYE